jgi:predicted nucleotidyltransferase
MKVSDKQDILNKIDENKDKLREFGVTKIGVFGSYTRNEQTKESDIDLLVSFEKGKKTYKNFYNLAEFAEGLLGSDVDLLTPQSISSYILPYIEKEITYVQVAN